MKSEEKNKMEWEGDITKYISRPKANVEDFFLSGLWLKSNESKEALPFELNLDEFQEMKNTAGKIDKYFVLTIDNLYGKPNYGDPFGTLNYISKFYGLSSEEMLKQLKERMVSHIEILGEKFYSMQGYILNNNEKKNIVITKIQTF